jgi:hypothetical protein
MFGDGIVAAVALVAGWTSTRFVGLSSRCRRGIILDRRAVLDSRMVASSAISVQDLCVVPLMVPLQLPGGAGSVGADRR